MCTVSFIPHEDGYLLAMNRDESVVRGRAALAPANFESAAGRAVYPRESDAGGTWIAANDHGVTLALLNRYDEAAEAATKQRSRGALIPELIQLHSASALETEIQAFPKQGMLPFRLIALLPDEHLVSEFRWDGNTLTSSQFEWTPRHWFSSGLSDQLALDQRGATAESYRSHEDFATAEWLRRLHASHEGGPGPFSVCVHRESVQSLSYTEIECSGHVVQMRHHAGLPCTMRGEELAIHSLPRTIHVH